MIPINDIRGLEGMSYTKNEKLLRCKLAAAYRLVEGHGWTQSIYNHISVRVSQDTEHFLINPFGMLYNEITASSLVKVDMQGSVVEAGTTNFGVNVAGFMLHAAIHSARPDLKCILHLHTPNIVAVSLNFWSISSKFHVFISHITLKFRQKVLILSLYKTFLFCQNKLGNHDKLLISIFEFFFTVYYNPI